MDVGKVRAALRPGLADRLAAVRVREGAISLVVEGTGLDAAARGAAETELKEALDDLADGKTVAVAFMGERVKRRIVAIGSGKGGVGKSTVTANLAVALKRAGVKVGVIDADIYGPSQPILLKSEDMKPEAEGETLQPVVGAAEIPMLSMGHLVNKGRALAWRGPRSRNCSKPTGAMRNCCWSICRRAPATYRSRCCRNSAPMGR